MPYIFKTPQAQGTTPSNTSKLITPGLGDASDSTRVLTNQTSITNVSTNIIDSESLRIDAKGMSAAGSVSLGMTLDFDPVAAIQNNVSTLTVNIKPTGGDPASTQRSLITPTSVLNDILFSASAGNFNTLNNQQVIRSTKIDLTSKISNATASQLSIRGGSLLGTQQVIKEVSPATTHNLATEIPILQIPKSNFPSGNTSEKSLFNSLIFTSNKSPSNIVDTSLKHQSVEETIAGLRPSAAFKKNTVTPTEQLVGTAQGIILGNTTAQATAGSSPNQTISLSNTYQPTLQVFTETITTIPITAGLTIPQSDLSEYGSIVQISIEAQDSEGNVVQVIGCTVDVIQKVLDATRYEGLLSLTANEGGLTAQSPTGFKEQTVDSIEYDNTFTIPRVSNEEPPPPSDGPPPSGGGGPNMGLPDVNIFKRNYSVYDEMDSEWDLEGSIPTDGGETITFSSQGGSGGTNINIGNENTTTEIRLVAQGFSPLSSHFVSFIRPAMNRNLTTASPFLGNAVAETDNRFISVTTFLRREGITIRVGNFQDTYSILVMRKDLTQREKDFKPLNVPEPIKLVDPNIPSVTFVDTSVKIDHIYEYRVKLITRRGREIFGSGSSTIKYQRLIDNSVKINTSQPKITYDASGNIDVRFSISGEVKSTSTNTIIKFLQDQSLEQFYENEIQTEREKLNEILVFGIERVDLTKGVIEDFGIITESTFSDKQFRQLNNVSPLIAGREYRYVITAYSRETDTLFETAARTRVDKQTQKRYSFSPAKFLSPETIRKSTISTPKGKTRRLEEIFKEGFSGAQKFIDVSTKIKPPEIVGGSCKKNDRRRIELRWKVRGSVNKIDHFIVIGTKLGMRTMIGKVHAFSTNNTFRFEDNVLHKEVGDITYSVIPVMNNMTMGKEVIIGTGSSRKKMRKVK